MLTIFIILLTILIGWWFGSTTTRSPAVLGQMSRLTTVGAGEDDPGYVVHGACGSCEAEPA